MAGEAVVHFHTLRCRWWRCSCRLRIWRSTASSVASVGYRCAKRLQLAYPPVEARLWEDPLGALNRHRQKLETCPKEDKVVDKAEEGEPTTDHSKTAEAGSNSTGEAKKDKSAETSAKAGEGGQHGARDAKPPAAIARASTAACQTGQPIDGDHCRDRLGDGGNVTLIAAMLPGTAWSGADEIRRRVRYATLAGLNVAGFAPDDGERMGLLHIKRCKIAGRLRTGQAHERWSLSTRR